ncbi:hypothetical protein [Chryseobacterium luteum]|uniref:Uncharacterized protein n=1 Tax=Chryseobacterium luteum TaxID=421531 RepID=A0A085ZX52_9FLAO|nr:hypothetical protein [Chryseobacterium luteum]KFF09016.1 hypothetical protein IX38_00415 [Chryseobacterium luteum]
MIQIITNAKGFNQSFEDFTRDRKTRYTAFNDEIQVIPKSILNKFDRLIFDDESLSKNEIFDLKQNIENKIKELLSTRIPEPDIRTKIEFLGQIIGLNYTPFGKNIQDLRIDKLFRAYKICEECLEENKPVYLSISENEN